MVPISLFTRAREPFSGAWDQEPWALTDKAERVIAGLVEHQAQTEMVLRTGWAVHATAEVDQSVTSSGPVFVGAGTTIGPNVHLRGGVYLGENVRVGSGCEVKSSWVLDGAALAHLNYVGNSVVGVEVNIEAGAVLANHFNERQDKAIHAVHDGRLHLTGVEKFGAMVGDGVRIGANAVTTPGTLLLPDSVVPRLGLVDQVSDMDR